jgi:hypothetical protein
MDEAEALIGHVGIETVSVLTRMPPPHRVPGRLVADFLAHHFPGPVLTLDSSGYGDVLAVAGQGRIEGGAIYDALVATAASRAGAVLVTLDQRAAATYRLVGCDYRLIG